MASPILDELLAKLPDNDVGAIDAVDLRQIVTALWDYTEAVQRTLNDVVVNAVPALELRTPLVGQVASDGTLVGGPEGWSSEYDPDTHLYTVHHDLGTEAYAVVITPMIKVEQGVAPAVDSTTETSFTYGLWNEATGGLHGAYANFVVGRLLS